MTLEDSPEGFRCTWAGSVTDADIDGYLAAAERLLPVGKDFTLIVDQREAKLLSEAHQARMQEVMNFFVNRGLTRVGLVTGSAVLAMQINRLSAETPAKAVQIAVSGADPDWEKVLLDWVRDGKRPKSVETPLSS